MSKILPFIFACRKPSSLTRRMNAKSEYILSRDKSFKMSDVFCAHVNLRIIPRAFSPLKFIILFFSLSTYAVFAQDLPSLGGVAINVEVADSEATNGDIISITKEGLKRSNVSYDIQMYGVIAAAPVLSVQPKTDKTKALVSSGIAEVKVSASKGSIEVGDYITSSEKPGVGEKATGSGYALGKALAKYDDNSKDGMITVDVNIGFASAATSPTGSGPAQLFENPKFLRYILAAVVAVLSVIGATFAFVRLMTSGVTALGRNPLAKKTIIPGIIISGVVASLLALAGLGVSVAIIFFGD